MPAAMQPKAGRKNCGCVDFLLPDRALIDLQEAIKTSAFANAAFIPRDDQTFRIDTYRQYVTPTM